MNETTPTATSLELTTETLRLLTPDQLRLVSGGRRPRTRSQCTYDESGCC